MEYKMNSQTMLISHTFTNNVRLNLHSSCHHMPDPYFFILFSISQGKMPTKNYLSRPLLHSLHLTLNRKPVMIKTVVPLHQKQWNLCSIFQKKLILNEF